MSFTDSEAARLAKLYGEAEKDILKALNRALLRGNKTSYLKAMLEQVRTIRRDLLDGARTWCEEAIPAAYLDGVEATELSGAIGAIHQQAMQVLAENTYQRFVAVDQVIGRRTDDIYRSLSLEAIRGDVAGYETWKQAAQNVREKLSDQGVTGFVDAAGREWDMTSYSEMVARTATRDTMVQGTANRLLEHDIDLVEVVGGRGGEGKVCEACARWVGRILSLTGKTAGYPTLAEAQEDGLLHPNCTHNIVAASDEAVAKAKDEEEQ